MSNRDTLRRGLPKERGRPARQLRGSKISSGHAGEPPALQSPPRFLGATSLD